MTTMSSSKLNIKNELFYFICECCNNHTINELININDENVYLLDLLGILYDPLQYNTNKVSYAQLLHHCYSIQISRNGVNDSLYICEICKDKLINAYKFKALVKKTQNCLKERKINFKSEPTDECYDDSWVEVGSSIKKDENEMNVNILEIKDNDSDDNQNDMAAKQNELKILLLDTEINYNETDIDYDESECGATEIALEDADYSPVMDDSIKQNYNTEEKTSYRKRKGKIKTVKSVSSKPTKKAKASKERNDLTSALNVLESNARSRNGTRRVQNNLDNLSKEELKEYRRVYRKQWYSRLVPFKLEKTDLVCKICNEKFLYNQQLVVHMKVHFPNHICDLCGMGFVTLKNLSNHRHITHDTSMEQCEICKKQVKKRYMKKHLGIHNGKRTKYKCTTCQETFLNTYKLRKHMTVVHNVAPQIHYCKFCPKTFASSGGLHLHVKKFHK